ncbi:hypothetical protein [Chroococcidiopsis cubana]|nr:hypothetical protein [Chroococcidiopsis cubana]
MKPRSDFPSRGRDATRASVDDFTRSNFLDSFWIVEQITQRKRI